MVSYRQNLSDCPKLTHHKGSGQGVVRLNGRDVYCGKFGTPECLSTYHRTIAEWLAQGRSYRGADGRTINEVIAAYLSYVDGYYTSAEPACIRLSLRPLRALYGSTPASEFGPLKLKIVRQAFIDAELWRAEVNKRTRPHELRSQPLVIAIESTKIRCPVERHFHDPAAW